MLSTPELSLLMQPEDILHSLALSGEALIHPARKTILDSRDKSTLYRNIAFSLQIMKDNLPSHLSSNESIARIISNEVNHAFSSNDINALLEGRYNDISGLALLKLFEFQGILGSISTVYTDIDSPVNGFLTKISEFGQRRS